MMTIHTPDQLYGELFTDVQSAHLFGDSKTFVDATPKHDPGDILKSYREQRSQPTFNLKTFVMDNFELPPLSNGCAAPEPGKNPRQQIEELWGILARQPDTASRHDSLIPLPKSYIVPGGRFREIYYWDSYFTMLGLAASGHLDKVRDMVDNFAYLIDQVGFIPNGNRSYYCSRSQPPYFALMVELLADESEDQAVYTHYLPQLEQEYRFWMTGAGDLARDGDACRRVIRLGEGYLNRHWDDVDIPRQESYAEDMALAARASGDSGSGDGASRELFRQIRAACESGWDFSSRWFDNPADMSSINTTRIVPVDLNCCLYKLEAVLAIAHRQAGDQEAAVVYEDRAQIRASAIRERFYCENQGWFADLRLPNLEYSQALSLAGVYPLFFGLASPSQAAAVSTRLQSDYLKAGGWVTTPVHSGQQWDAPNGWAPLQWIVYRGLVRYGYTEEAEEGARRWVKNNLQLYEKTGKFIEKYDVENPGTLAGGGEYEVQDGFGWTNGVLLTLMNKLGL